jgi:Fur family transcriptional regulator, ferric uptake regulator
VSGGRDEKNSVQNHARPLDIGRLRRSLDNYMRQQGLRSTEQRRLIVDTFFEIRGHVSIEQLLDRVRAIDSRVGYATIYRTMKMLAACGVAVEQHFGDGFTRYEMSDEQAHHDHLICLSCGSIMEFEEPAIELLQQEVATRFGFLVSEHKHELYGLCLECQRMGKVLPGTS